MIGDTLFLVVELAALFVGVAFLVHLSQRWLGEERLRRWMGGRPVVSALKGIAVGFITPFCTYSAIPMLIGLRRAGVPPVGYVAFIVAAPVLDPVLFGALILIVGVKAATVYVAVAFTGALGLALTAQRVGIERHFRPVTRLAQANTLRVPQVLAAPLHSSDMTECGETHCVSSDERVWRGFKPEALEASRSAFELLRTLGPILLLGVGVGVAIELLVPSELVASIAGEGSRFAIPIAAGLGTPLYLNTELLIPIADSLSAVGVGIGAVVALTIAGAGANLPEFVILGRLAKPRALTVFVGYVFAVAMVGGIIAQAVTA